MDQVPSVNDCEMMRLALKYYWEGGLGGYCMYGPCQLFYNTFPKYADLFIDLNHGNKYDRKLTAKAAPEIDSFFIPYLEMAKRHPEIDLNKYNYI